mmetsp:Transcript_4238/g.8877  ORF Transcript_4238/g.8877 Transcript_4238/m.8877 type:complete len:165 (+) Transcript_4238:1210-1704(+)
MASALGQATRGTVEGRGLTQKAHTLPDQVEAHTVQTKTHGRIEIEGNAAVIVLRLLATMIERRELEEVRETRPMTTTGRPRQKIVTSAVVLSLERRRMQNNREDLGKSGTTEMINQLRLAHHRSFCVPPPQYGSSLRLSSSVDWRLRKNKKSRNNWERNPSRVR